ncbi:MULTISPECIES: UDP-2,3-diacylglucosamine diphosphatase [unclassified Herbaspirillum]|uniref:UDP-2,3-diacylglucosamine diphosphatase n=1 Tax=unclassified Herbaspirillum TaxID=2624150 RepID=UPI000E2ED9A2|nr:MULTISPECIES: UDP-2,3-diacylglucosamine diphosphatase [unclassified Herbaspirillum]RFB69686.1 UDP-2,3-diacylglucosamine diphosphatase [Herbaspirillum sp. 3R-3a1]TFI07250.1 UDP-2,3-diacylglucosamine diphosphatase [Herbaspirillum sp. 3R11]TFI13188.1 UDP-2,3-diacylglucosamine diphosphatase [Herbaspirillum sp. 3R-11]TFI20082.1 UDP-2,3-diacylglucosamine diphosphatase [Herbaspirillum sp. 3C11]
MKSRDQFLDANGIDAALGKKRDPLHFRTIWISDVHLGTPGCQAQRLLEFLRATESETLYLVGDIIDGWQLKRRWYWEQSHNNVVQTVLKKAKKGTNVIFVPGNHDEVIRQFIDLDFGGIKIRDELVHTTANGKRMLVIHGDRFDGVIACAKWLAYVGDNLYTMILKFNQWFNSWRARAGLPYWSLSQYLKGKVKNAVNYITSFEDALAAEAAKKGLDGVICGHIHKPEIRDINGITYCNDGDWVESLSALVEDETGELRLVTWGEIMQLKKSSKLAGVEDLCALPS